MNNDNSVPSIKKNHMYKLMGMEHQYQSSVSALQKPQKFKVRKLKPTLNVTERIHTEQSNMEQNPQIVEHEQFKKINFKISKKMVLNVLNKRQKMHAQAHQITQNNVVQEQDTQNMIKQQNQPIPDMKFSNNQQVGKKQSNQQHKNISTQLSNYKNIDPNLTLGEMINRQQLINSYKNQYKQFTDLSQKQLQQLFDKAYKAYKKKNILTVKQIENLVKRPNKSLQDELTILNTTIFHTKKYFLKLSQILAIVMYINQQRLILEILTGEGKSVIIACIAAIFAIRGLNVDIITTSEVLAIRDSQQFCPFYTILGLKVDNIFRQQNKHQLIPKQCYKPKTIIYGTSNKIQSDILSDPFNLINIRYNRKYEVVIIDEVDSMFIDESSSRTQLMNSFPGYEQLLYILKIIWAKVNLYECLINDNKQQQQKHIYTVVTVIDSNGYNKILGKVQNLIHVIIQQVKQQIGNQLYTYWLEDLVQLKLKSWIMQAYNAMIRYKQYVDYVVIEGQIKIVDNKNTGVIRDRTKWSNGLHQFLELKHGLEVSAQEIVSKFMSNLALYDKYQYLYGLTGTLGIRESKSYFHGIYKVNIMAIPPDKKRILQHRNGTAWKQEQQWGKQILKQIKFIISQNRAVLVIFQSIWNLEMIYKLLEADGTYNMNKVIGIKIQTKQLDRKLDGGYVVLATNLAGRGTDFKLTQSLQKAGGLHVIVSFLSNNTRIEKQARGRAGRNGMPGSGQCIICLQHCKIMINKYKDMLVNKQSYMNYNSSTIMPEIQAIQIKNQQHLLNHGKGISKHIRNIDKYYQKYIDLAKKRISTNKKMAECFEQVWARFFIKNLQLQVYKPEKQNEIRQKCNYMFQVMENDPFQILYPSHLIKLAYVSIQGDNAKMTEKCLKILENKNLNLIQRFHTQNIKLICSLKIKQKQNKQQIFITIKLIIQLLNRKIQLCEIIGISQASFCLQEITIFHQKKSLNDMLKMKQKMKKIDPELAHRFNQSQQIDIGKIRKNYEQSTERKSTQITFLILLKQQYQNLIDSYKNNQQNTIQIGYYDISQLFSCDNTQSINNHYKKLIQVHLARYNLLNIIYVKPCKKICPILYSQLSNRSYRYELMYIQTSILIKQIMDPFPQFQYQKSIQVFKKLILSTQTKKQKQQKNLKSFLQRGIQISICGQIKFIQQARNQQNGNKLFLYRNQQHKNIFKKFFMDGNWCVLFLGFRHHHDQLSKNPSIQPSSDTKQQIPLVQLLLLTSQIDKIQQPKSLKLQADKIYNFYHKYTRAIIQKLYGSQKLPAEAIKKYKLQQILFKQQNNTNISIQSELCTFIRQENMNIQKQKRLYNFMVYNRNIILDIYKKQDQFLKGKINKFAGDIGNYIQIIIQQANNYVISVMKTSYNQYYESLPYQQKYRIINHMGLYGYLPRQKQILYICVLTIDLQLFLTGMRSKSIKTLQDYIHKCSCTSDYRLRLCPVLYDEIIQFYREQIVQGYMQQPHQIMKDVVIRQFQNRYKEKFYDIIQASVKDKRYKMIKQQLYKLI